MEEIKLSNNEGKYKILEEKSDRNRVKILDMVYWGKSGHIGGALSAVDIITYLGECVINYAEEERDRFLLSKGHAVPALYAELNELGFIADEELKTYRQINSRLQGHIVWRRDSVSTKIKKIF